MDRISRGFAEQYTSGWIGDLRSFFRQPAVLIALVSIVMTLVIFWFFPFLIDSKKSGVLPLASPIDKGVMHLIANYSHVTDAIKNAMLFYFLLPLKIGFESTVRPFTWGFELTNTVIFIYTAIVVSLSFLSGWLIAWRTGIAVALLGIVYYFGISRIPWPVFILVTTVIAWRTGGWRVGLFSAGGLVFMLLTGIWPKAMLSFYLCGAATLTAFGIGLLIGIGAAHSDRFSAMIRPVIDTLQTMPMFVFLIPVLMFFLIGEFSAYLAVIAYAVAPAIRYTEHGLREVPFDIVEAAQAIGCANRHILFQVRLPLALPEIMLGLNQTINFALAMLVISALVGSQGLGQVIYIGLTSADFGTGIIAGLGMALIAMIGDRIIQSWSTERKAALGIGNS